MFRFFKELFNTTTTKVEQELTTAKATVANPDTVLANLVWAFNRKPYDSQTEFDEEISRYQKDILRAQAYWKGEETVIHAPEVEVCYEAWIRSIDDLKSNEELLDDQEEVFDEDNEEDGFFQVEISAKLQAANGSSFSALDIMYQMEHQVSNKELGDHIFFEGFQRAQGYNGALPLYHMVCGS